MIELRNVTKTYPTRDGLNVVLDAVDFTFPARTNIGVLGRNGAGKSTLLRVISGAEQPDTGEVVHRGRVSWPIGFSGGIHSALTGEENCRLVARLYGVDVDEVVASTMDFAELGGYFYEPARTYSSGMRARLAFGLSMAVDFDVFLVDEVTAVGDAGFKAKARKAFDERRERSSLIIVSHSLSTVKAFCKHGAVLRNGKLHYFDSIEAARRLYEAA